MIDACKFVGVTILSSIDANVGESGIIEVIAVEAVTGPECPSEILSSPQDRFR